MHRVIYILLVLVLFASCKKETKVNEGTYEINGTIDKIENNKLVTLVKSENRTQTIIDSARTANKGFTLQGTIDGPDMYYLNIEGIRGNLPLIVENTAIKVNINSDSIFSSKINGSKENDYLITYQEFAKNLQKKGQLLNQQAQAANQEKDTATITALRKKYQELIAQNNEHDLEFIKANPDAILSALILERGATVGRKYNVQEVKKLFENLSNRVKNSPKGKQIQEYIKINEQSAIGSVAPDFSAPNPAGKEVSLNSIKGKVTIIDFWASWCAPCRRENPNLVKLYEAYHDKGLEIIGVSLDGSPRQKDPKKAWIDAILKDKLTWQQVTNLKYFNDPIAKKYNVSSIPAAFILDQTGTIVAKNLRGKQLEAKISELLD